MITYNPGPSQPYPRLSEYVAAAIDDGVVGWSHRSPQFCQMLANTENNLRRLLRVPPAHQLWFLSSATEAMERIIQNTVATTSFHVQMGAFSKKFADIASQLGKTVITADYEWGSGPDLDAITVPAAAELIAVTHNETSTGVALDPAAISRLRQRYPDALLAVDMVSSAPIADLDLTAIDLAFFSVQKAFGLPSGLGVLIAGPRALATATRLSTAGHILGSYHSFPSLTASAAKHQTPETPNSLGIYLLGQVAGDMLETGLDAIRQQISDQAAALYAAVEAHPHLQPLVHNPAIRSETVIVAEVTGGNRTIIDSLSAAGHHLGTGYAHQKTTHIRIANFPAHLGTTASLIKQLRTRTRN